MHESVFMRPAGKFNPFKYPKKVSVCSCFDFPAGVCCSTHSPVWHLSADTPSDSSNRQKTEHEEQKDPASLRSLLALWLIRHPAWRMSRPQLIFLWQVHWQLLNWLPRTEGPLTSASTGAFQRFEDSQASKTQPSCNQTNSGPTKPQTSHADATRMGQTAETGVSSEAPQQSCRHEIQAWWSD